MTSVKTEQDMVAVGKQLGKLLRGGEIIELVGDVGAGKTTLAKGIGLGLSIDEAIQSPSFTISRIYDARDGLSLHHYDFYRLSDPGVMSYELAESLKDPNAVTVVEWADVVSDVLPTQHLKVSLTYTPEGSGRIMNISVPPTYEHLKEFL